MTAQDVRLWWRDFGWVVKDPRIKVILYPLLVVVGVLLTQYGHFLFEEYGPGPIYLVVHVTDKVGKPLKNAHVGFTAPKRGPYKSHATDADGNAPFVIDRRNKGATIALGVVLDGYKSQDMPTSVKLTSDVVNKTVILEKEAPDISTTQRAVAANVYRSPTGYWEKTADGWKEHRYDRPEVLTFEEFRRDSDYVYLVDKSRLKDKNPANPLWLRLPIKGGTAQWSWQNPVAWIDLTIVNRGQ